MRGRVVGKYQIGDPLGEGGMGVVYRAEHVVLGSPAAVKVLLPQFARDAVTVERFFQEAKAASAIRHVGITEVFDYGRLGDEAYIAMELLRGEDLTSFIARHGRLDASVAAQVALQVLAALNAAHVVGVVHRDLKPDNIFLVRDGGAPGGIRVKLLDFGIAKLIGAPLGEAHAAKKAKTGAATILGTPSYMAPEQCKGGTDLDARADLYAVGCILFEMLAGRPPFVAEGGGEVMAMHIYEPPPRLHQLAPELPVELDALLAKLLAKAPDDRIPSAAYALAALERVPLEPLAAEVPLAFARASTANVAPAPAALPPAAAVRDPLPRWVLGVAIAIAIAAAVAIGVS